MLNKTTHPVPNAHHTLRSEEIGSAFAAMAPLIPRLRTVVTIDEAGALLVILRLAGESASVRARAMTAVVGVLPDYIGRNGVLSPSCREIARRLALTLEDVDTALETLIADGYLVELRPSGFLRPQRRFWLRKLGTPPPQRRPWDRRPRR